MLATRDFACGAWRGGLGAAMAAAALVAAFVTVARGLFAARGAAALFLGVFAGRAAPCVAAVSGPGAAGDEILGEAGWRGK